MPRARLDPAREHPQLAATGRALTQAFWALAGGVIVAYVFFVALGAVGWSEAGALTLVVLALALAWVVHAVLQARRQARDPHMAQVRERRGF